MSMGKFFSTNSQLSKQLAPNATTDPSRPAAVSDFTNKNNVASLVEHHFKRMSEAHDRIRTQLLSQLQNSR